jgi:4-hydroxy-4-methyl-2-oxoglutarate aldolase
LVEKEISDKEMAERLLSIPTATIYDALDSMGYEGQCLSLEIKPISYDMRVTGRAFTVRGSREPRTEEVNPKFQDFGMFKAMRPLDVIVIDAEKEANCGHWGEMMSYASKRYGAVGVVIDGGIRDGRSLLNIPEWSVFVRYTSPIESARRWRPIDFQIPIYMSGTLTAQVRVDPGDWIVGDMDGVIVIPKAIAQKVLTKAEEIERDEENTRQALASGMPIDEVYRKYRRL